MFFRACHYCHKDTLWTFVKQIFTRDGKDTGWDKYQCSVCERMSFMKCRQTGEEK